MSHRNARLTPNGRRIIIERVLAGRPVAHVAKEMGISRTCAHRWLSRTAPTAGMALRTGVPVQSPARTPPRPVSYPRS